VFVDLEWAIGVLVGVVGSWAGEVVVDFDGVGAEGGMVNRRRHFWVQAIVFYCSKRNLEAVS
jgi:hypothetical protein